MPRAFADLLLARVRVALDDDKLLDAATMLKPLIMSSRVVYHRAFGLEVLRCVSTLFTRSWPPGSPIAAATMQRFGETFFAESKSDIALYCAVQQLLLTQEYKAAFIVLQDRLIDCHVLRSTYRLLAAILAHRIWHSERTNRQFSRAELAHSMPVAGEPRPSLTVTAAPPDWLRVSLFLSMELATPRQLEPDQPVADQPVAADVNSAQPLPPPSLPQKRDSSSSSSASRNGKSTVDTSLFRHVPRLSADQPDGLPQEPPPQPSPQQRRTRVMPHKPFNESQVKGVVEGAAIELLASVHEDAGDVETAESLLSRFADAHPGSLHALTMLLSFWQRHAMPSANKEAFVALTRRVFDLDATNTEIFRLLRQFCGDPGPNLVGTAEDVMSIAMARVTVVPDDVASWLWLARLATEWHADAQKLFDAYDKHAKARHVALAAYRRVVRQQERYWQRWSVVVTAALPVPARLRSKSTTDVEYFLMLYKCTFADAIAPHSPPARAFLRAAKAILHPLDVDAQLYKRVIAHVRSSFQAVSTL
jgi:hypothetical protein